MGIRIYGAAGPLAGFRDGYRAALIELGYTRVSVRQQMVVFNQFNRYMGGLGTGVGSLDEALIGRFIEARIEEGFAQALTARYYAPMLEYLRGLAACPPAASGHGVRRGAEAVLASWREYLLSVRSLTPQSARGYLDAVRPLLVGLERGDRLDLEEIGQVHINEFVLACGRRCAPKTVARTASALRCFLRYAFVKGLTTQDMSLAVPGACCPSLALPKFLAMTDVAKMVERCDTATVAGLRDRAIVLVLARLGLRAGEAARLRLEDIDWSGGLIAVAGKGSKSASLPLPVDVGRAIADYLRARPATAVGRTVFVRVKAPHRALTAGGVTQAVAAASERAGLGTLFAHRLRHTAATSMLAGGAALPEVAHVLRHERLVTTANYARVDLEALRAVARAWNGGRA
jgi:site-specific recombinase XerD